MPKNRLIRRTAPSQPFTVFGTADISGSPVDDGIREWVWIADVHSLSTGKRVMDTAEEFVYPGTNTQLYDEIRIYDNNSKSFVSHPSIGIVNDA